MSHDLWQIVYQSVRTFDNADAFEGNHEILQVSTHNNARDGLTGLLVEDEGKFFQALEGAHDPTRACMKRIESDRRHHGVRTLIDRAADRRRFSRWSMGFVDIAEIAEANQIADMLHSGSPEQVLEGLVLAGSEHGLVQRVMGGSR
jgi:hypothetical protein